MHEKMMNAKTPQERSKLMAEHMKAMQNGMSMMEGMSGMGAWPARAVWVPAPRRHPGHAGRHGRATR